MSTPANPRPGPWVHPSHPYQATQGNPFHPGAQAQAQANYARHQATQQAAQVAMLNKALEHLLPGVRNLFETALTKALEQSAGQLLASQAKLENGVDDHFDKISAIMQGISDQILSLRLQKHIQKPEEELDNHLGKFVDNDCCGICGNEEEPTGSEKCPDDKEITWIGCDKCLQWTHLECISYVCKRCTSE